MMVGLVLLFVFASFFAAWRRGQRSLNRARIEKTYYQNQANKYKKDNEELRKINQSQGAQIGVYMAKEIARGEFKVEKKIGSDHYIRKV